MQRAMGIGRIFKVTHQGQHATPPAYVLGLSIRPPIHFSRGEIIAELMTLSSVKFIDSGAHFDRHITLKCLLVIYSNEVFYLVPFSTFYHLLSVLNCL